MKGWIVGFGFAILLILVSISVKLQDISETLKDLNVKSLAEANIDLGGSNRNSFVNSVVASMNYIWDDEKQVWNRMRQPKLEE